MEINNSANDRYPRKRHFGPLSILTFLTFIWQINCAPQPNGGLNNGDDSNIVKMYEDAIAKQEKAVSDVLEIEAKLERVKKNIQSFSDKELLAIKQISLLTTSLAQADSRSARKDAKRDVLKAEKKLLDVIDKVRAHKERLMNVNKRLEKAKKRVEKAKKRVEKAKTRLEMVK